MDASDRDRKKAWKLQQRKLAQDAFPISDALLESLFQAVNAKDRELGLRPHIAIHSGMDSKKQATGGGNTYVVTRTRLVLATVKFSQTPQITGSRTDDRLPPNPSFHRTCAKSRAGPVNSNVRHLMPLDNDALLAACLEVARSIRWRDNPVDEVLAKAAVEIYFNAAIQHEDFLVGQGRDPNIIVRAVRYIACKHAIPPLEGNVEAFESMLDVLIELACPNQGVEEDQEAFFKDIEEGIRDARSDYA